MGSRSNILPSILEIAFWRSGNSGGGRHEIKEALGDRMLPRWGNPLSDGIISTNHYARQYINNFDVSAEVFPAFGLQAGFEKRLE
jgi:hypothetical protein